MFPMRLIYLLALISSLVLISIDGGNIPYMLLFFVVLSFVFSAIYILYVNVRIRIFQDVDTYNLVKGTPIRYHLIFENNDPLPFLNLSFRYYPNATYSSPELLSQTHHLAPYQRMEHDMFMYCKYSGIYEIGIEKIVITDYLHLFRLSFPMPQPTRIEVRPRILPMDFMQSLLENTTSASQSLPPYSLELAPDLRKYRAGDTLRQIHWRNSARYRCLLSRAYEPEDKSSISLFVDASLPHATGTLYSPSLETIIVRDKFLELLIGCAAFYLQRTSALQIYLDLQHRYDIHCASSFSHFYERICSNSFQGTASALEIASQISASFQLRQILLVTSDLSPSRRLQLAELLQQGTSITLLYISMEKPGKSFYEHLSHPLLRVVTIAADEELGGSSL